MNIFCKIGLNILSMNNYTRIYIILNKNEDKYKISHRLTWFSCFILDFFFLNLHPLQQITFLDCITATTI